jgi:hypothetical protein
MTCIRAAHLSTDMSLFFGCLLVKNCVTASPVTQPLFLCRRFVIFFALLCRFADALVWFRGETIFVLVTDVGFADLDNVVWEKLNSVTGATEFVDQFFQSSLFESDDAYLQARRRSSLHSIREAADFKESSSNTSCLIH